jgi:hypothetical protein
MKSVPQTRQVILRRYKGTEYDEKKLTKKWRKYRVQMGKIRVRKKEAKYEFLVKERGKHIHRRKMLNEKQKK